MRLASHFKSLVSVTHSCPGSEPIREFCWRFFGRPGSTHPEALLPARPPSPQRESLAQVDAPHLHVVAKFVGRPRTENPAFSNNVRPIGHSQCFTNVMVCDQDSDPFRLQVENNLLQFQNSDRIDPAEWLVKQDELGLNAQGAR